jgi:hypothetical protein
MAPLRRGGAGAYGQRHHARLIALGERRFADHSERLAAEVAIYEWTVREIEAGGGA